MNFDVAFSEQATELAVDFGEKIEMNQLVVQSMTVKRLYAISTSNTDTPTEWLEEAPTPTASHPYLWVKTNTSYLTVDGNVYAFSDNGVVTGVHGRTGATGQRGAGQLSITTAPSLNTTDSPYRILTSTVKAQAGVNEVLVGDTLRHSYYLYPVVSVTNSYVYCGTRVSIRGEKGDSATDEQVANAVEEYLAENPVSGYIEGDVFAGYDRFYDSIARMQVNPTAPLDIATYDGSNKPTHPKVLFFENGWAGHKFWLTYSPFPANNNTYENPCIEYSDDGVNFTSAGVSNPIEDTPMENGVKVGYNSDPHLVLVNGVMECWWRTHYQSGTNAEHEVIYRKTSDDGITWSEKEELFRVNDASAGSCLSPAVIFEDGIYKIWTVYKQQVMRYYESTTGANWTHIRDINVDNPDYPTYKVWHIDVIHTEKGYEFVGCYHPTSDYNDNRYIYYAVSSDNITYSDRVLILTPGPTGNFDATELYRPAILRLDNKVVIYYGCRNGSGNWKIGMIEAPNPYLFNAVLKNGLRFADLESRISALEGGTGGNTGGDSGDSGGSSDPDIANSFEDSTWTAGYYNDSGAIITELQLHHSQLIPVPTDGTVVRYSTSASYLRISYFDADKNYVTYDRGSGLGVTPANPSPSYIDIDNAGGTYYAVNANTNDKSAIAVSVAVDYFETTAEPIAYYDGSNHGATIGEWAEANGGDSISVTGGTWTDGVLATDGVDDKLVLPLTGAKSVVIRAKLLSDYSVTAKAAYFFDCRTTATAYLLNYNKTDYIGTAATVYAGVDKFVKATTGFADRVTIGEWYYFTIVFASEFTGNMVICAHNSGISDFMQAEIENIKVYDVDITT